MEGPAGWKGPCAHHALAPHHPPPALSFDGQACNQRVATAANQPDADIKASRKGFGLVAQLEPANPSHFRNLGSSLMDARGELRRDEAADAYLRVVALAPWYVTRPDAQEFFNPQLQWALLTTGRTSEAEAMQDLALRGISVQRVAGGA